MRRGSRARGRSAERGLPSAPCAGSSRCKLPGEGVFPRERPEGSGDLSPPGDAELLSKDVAVRLRRPWRDAEPDADLFIRATPGDQLDHLELPLSQDERRVVGSAHGDETTLARARQPLADRSIPRYPSIRA